MARRVNRTITDPLGDEVQQAWARCAILLNTGDLQAANEAGLAASKATHWHRRFGAYDCEPAVRVYGSKHIALGWMWAEVTLPRRVVVSDQIKSEFQDSIALWDLAGHSVQQQTSGWHAFDVANWRVQQRAHNAMYGLDEDGLALDLDDADYDPL
jgi:hypothetical protein